MGPSGAIKMGPSGAIKKISENFSQQKHFSPPKNFLSYITEFFYISRTNL